jgi:hypothetical protein
MAKLIWAILSGLMLSGECESLRALFVRQQQQHIAFWSGPFLVRSTQ